MNQQPDKLFRDKLQSFQTPAPSGAWSRIEANLDKKNDNVLWLRIAASLLIVAIAAYLLWPSNSIKTPQPELAGKTTTEKTIKPQPHQKEEEKMSAPPAVDNEIATRKKRIEKPAVSNAQGSAPVEQHKPVMVDQSINLSETNSTASHNANEERLPEQVSTPVEMHTVVANAETQKLKIIFSAEEVDNKYLDKKALAEATSDDKKPSTLKKLLDKAYDLKYNQDPFGDLRQRKDEILALNFRKDKRSDNK
ncbi:MAG TPA: hypothetical protein VGD65_04205 [Chryseosolibacter sp.]